jgi:hypothetical protein
MNTLTTSPSTGISAKVHHDPPLTVIHWQSAIILLALGSFALCPVAQAVVPSPDGGYPNFNTAEGQNALFNLTTGSSNTAVGWFSLFSDTDGSFNTAVGAGSLLFNIGDQNTGEGLSNTAIGTAGLCSTPPAPTTQPLERRPF